MERAAHISADGRYRYTLSRQWRDPMPARTPVRDAWVMLNPSTADGTVDDPTIRRCIRFSLRWGADGLWVVNLFALRATDPAVLAGDPDPVGPDNDDHLRWVTRAAALSGGRTVVAWGAHPAAKERARAVLDGRRVLVGRPMCLGTTKAGAPRHPLYVRGDAPLIEWRQ